MWTPEAVMKKSGNIIIPIWKKTGNLPRCEVTGKTKSINQHRMSKSSQMQI